MNGLNRSIKGMKKVYSCFDYLEYFVILTARLIMP